MISIKRIFLILLLALSHSLYALSDLETRLVERVKQNFPQQLNLIKKTVNINSGTHNVEGVKKVGAAYIEPLEGLGFKTQWIDVPAKLKRAGHLFAFKEGSPNSPRILLIGHLDTVFEPHHNTPAFHKRGNFAYGPGISDTKGGNAVMLAALKALHQEEQLKDANITIALIGDEEDGGKPHSEARKALIAAGKNSDIALGFENAENLDYVVTGRRGVASWQLTTKARGGHSSLIFTPQFHEGAILAATDLLLEMKKASQEISNLTFNVGLIAGGSQLQTADDGLSAKARGKVNIIPARAYGMGEIRFLDEADLDTLARKVRIKIKQLPKQVIAKLKIDRKNLMPAMTPSSRNLELFNALSAVNKDLDLPTLQHHNPRYRGGADIAYVAKNVAGLDGLGAVGGNEHSKEEFMNISKTRQATERITIFLNRLIINNEKF